MPEDSPRNTNIQGTYDTPGNGFRHSLHPFSVPRHQAQRDRVQSLTSNLIDKNSTRQEAHFFLREADFLAEYKKYTTKYPKLKDVFTLLELSLGANRNDFHRMEDLTIGFLSTVCQSLIARPVSGIGPITNPTGYVFKRWHEIARFSPNAGLLHSELIPQDFYDEITVIAKTILNEYPDAPGKEPRDPVFFGGAYGHPLAHDIVMKLGKVSLPIRFIEYIAEKIINELIAEKVWGNFEKSTEKIPSENGGYHVIDTREVIRDSLSMCQSLFSARLLSTNLEESPYSQISVDLPLLRSGIEEFVDLRLDLIRENYRAVIDRLGSRKEKQTKEGIDSKTQKRKNIKETVQIIGRLDDANYKIFGGHYYLLGLQFLTTHEIPVQTWTKKHTDYISLVNLFHLKLGMKKSEMNSGLSIPEFFSREPDKITQEIEVIKRRIGILLGIPEMS